ncbi:hypothetical protein ScPMuIL_002797 [Solemya velum]
MHTWFGEIQVQTYVRIKTPIRFMPAVSNNAFDTSSHGLCATTAFMFSTGVLKDVRTANRLEWKSRITWTFVGHVRMEDVAILVLPWAEFMLAPNRRNKMLSNIQGVLGCDISSVFQLTKDDMLIGSDIYRTIEGRVLRVDNCPELETLSELLLSRPLFLRVTLVHTEVASKYSVDSISIWEAIESWYIENQGAYPGCDDFHSAKSKHSRIYITNYTTFNHCFDCSPKWWLFFSPCWMMSAPCYFSFRRLTCKDLRVNLKADVTSIRSILATEKTSIVSVQCGNYEVPAPSEANESLKKTITNSSSDSDNETRIRSLRTQRVHVPLNEKKMSTFLTALHLQERAMGKGENWKGVSEKSMTTTGYYMALGLDI